MGNVILEAIYTAAATASPSSLRLGDIRKRKNGNAFCTSVLSPTLARLYLISFPLSVIIFKGFPSAPLMTWYSANPFILTDNP